MEQWSIFIFGRAITKVCNVFTILLYKVFIQYFKIYSISSQCLPFRSRKMMKMFNLDF